jgi:hypothetical protein
MMLDSIFLSLNATLGYDTANVILAYVYDLNDHLCGMHLKTGIWMLCGA